MWAGLPQPVSGLLLESLSVFQTANERLEILGDERDLVIPLLIDVNHLWLPTRTARPVIQANHVMPGRGAIREVDADRRIAPLIDPKLAAALPAQ